MSEWGVYCPSILIASDRGSKHFFCRRGMLSCLPEDLERKVGIVLRYMD